MSTLSQRESGRFSQAAAQPEPAGTVPEDAAADLPLDTLASVLRVYGSNGFDIDSMDAVELDLLCEAWARHILTGTPAPQGEGEPQEPSALEAVAVSERRWGDLRKFFRDHRLNERSAAIGRGEQVRGLITEVARGVRSAISDDAVKDEMVTRELSALSDAVDSDSLDAIRTQVSKTIEVVSHVVRARQARYEAQLRSMSQRVRTLRADLIDMREKVNLDPLTKVHNRGAFDSVLAKQVDFSFLSGQPLGLIMIDLDHFKQINDTHGHPGGDVVLQSVVEVLVRVCPRRSDFIARYGGEEFAVILVDVEANDLMKVGERILDGIRGLTIDYREKSIAVTSSIGMASYLPEDRAEDLLRRADGALYEAKNSGRDRAVMADW